MLREFRSLIPYLKRYRLQYGIGFVFLIIVDAAQILMPQLLKRAVDTISGGVYELSSVLRWSLLLVVAASVLSIGRFFWRFFIHGSSRRIESELRERLFAHMISLSSDFFQKNKIGDLMARATNDLNSVRMSIGMGLVAFVDGTIMAAAILVVMFSQNPSVAFYSVLPLPLVTVLILFFGKVVGKRFSAVQEKYSTMSEISQETVSGIRVVKSFVKEAYFLKKFADSVDDYLTANMELVKVFGFFFPFIAFLSGITSLILLRFGGVHVLDGAMSAGDLVAMFSYLQMLIWPMTGAGFTVNMLQRGAKSLKRVNAILETESSVIDAESPIRPKSASGVKGLIQIRNLDYSYGEGRPVLEGVDLTLPSGAAVGIFGKTGSGKSTFLKLLPRLLDPPPKSIFIDGIDVRDYELPFLRSLFGVAPQDSYLFSDSIRSNIAYGVPDLDDHRLADVASVSTISRDAADFKDGLNTVIGERGLSLSGGQKQRVAISRAIALEPAILLLDDSFSAVDTDTEAAILDMLLPRRRGKTTLLVSHRVSSLSRTDLIVVFEAGSISEVGTHTQLISSGGYYAATAKLQQLETGEHV